MIKDGYSGFYGENIYYKGNSFTDKLKAMFDFNKKTTDIHLFEHYRADGYNLSSPDFGKDAMRMLYLDCTKLEDTFLSDFFDTTIDNKGFNSYFKTKDNKYPENYALKFNLYNRYSAVKTANKDYYLFKKQHGGLGQSFLVEAKYIDEEIFNKETTKFTHYKDDGSIVYVEKSFTFDIDRFTFKDNEGTFGARIFIIQKDALAEENGGYRVFNYKNVLDYESEEGFLPVLKPYRYNYMKYIK
jgi:hypothetical protein